jgi:hypothetical protein
VKLRPVVAKCRTAIEALSKWLDCEFQKLVGMVLCCIKDSDSFRSEVIELELLPNARLVTFDAVYMYSNIDLNHAMEVMQCWFKTLMRKVQGFLVQAADWNCDGNFLCSFLCESLFSLAREGHHPIGQKWWEKALNGC